MSIITIIPTDRSVGPHCSHQLCTKGQSVSTYTGRGGYLIEYVLNSGQSRTVQSIPTGSLLVVTMFALRHKYSKGKNSYIDIHGNKIANRLTLRERAVLDGYELLGSGAATTPQRACKITFLGRLIYEWHVVYYKTILRGVRIGHNEHLWTLQGSPQERPKG